jgi:hypothetical protein
MCFFLAAAPVVAGAAASGTALAATGAAAATLSGGALAAGGFTAAATTVGAAATSASAAAAAGAASLGGGLFAGMSAFELISMGLSGVSTVMGGIQSAQQSAAMKSQYEYQAQMQRYQQDIDNKIATQIQEDGDREEKLFRMQASQQAGKIRSAFGGSGVAVDSGSPLDIITDTEALADQDRLAIRTNTARKAWQMRVNGQQAGQQASLFSASAANQNPMLSGGSSLLTGAAGTAEKWYRYRSA